MFESTDSWGDADQTRKDTQGGTFLRLKEGEECELVFPKQPFGFRQVWLQSENRSEIYDPAKHDGLRPSGRFAFPVFVLQGEQWAPQLFQASGEAYDEIREAIEEDGPACLYRLRRKGAGKETKYRVKMLRKLTDGEVETLRGKQLVDAEAIVMGREDDPATDMPEGKDPWGE